MTGGTWRTRTKHGVENDNENEHGVENEQADDAADMNEARGDNRGPGSVNSEPGSSSSSSSSSSSYRATPTTPATRVTMAMATAVMTAVTMVVTTTPAAATTADTNSAPSGERTAAGPLAASRPAPGRARATLEEMPDDSSLGKPYLSVRGAVLVFVLSGLGAVVLIGIAVVLLARHEARDDAVRGARDLAVAEARSTVEPMLTDAVVHNEPAAQRALDETVRERVLSDRIVRVKVWTGDGTVVYSDEPRLIGRTFGLDASEQQALATSGTHAELSDLAKPENQYENSFGKLLEVYVGTHTKSGTPVLYESYLSYSSVDAAGRRTLTGLLPALIGGLAILFMVQVPLAWSLARRVERSRAKEQRLLRSSLEAVDTERRHIAADLHDGVVQSLVGTSLSITAGADEAKRAGMPALGERLDTAAGDLRQGVRDLRSLIVAIAPPRLHDEGLAAALDDLVSPLAARGMEATLRVDGDLELPTRTETLLYRGAQEALRNVVRHAGARTVDVSIEHSDGVVRLAVEDDGVGFSPELMAERRTARHVGLRLLDELANGAGGSARSGERARRGDACAPRGAVNVIRVVVVDDHAVVRRGLIDVLNGSGDILVVADVDDGAAAVAAVALHASRRGAHGSVDARDGWCRGHSPARRRSAGDPGAHTHLVLRAESDRGCDRRGRVRLSAEGRRARRVVAWRTRRGSGRGALLTQGGQGVVAARVAAPTRRRADATRTRGPVVRRGRSVEQAHRAAAGDQ